MLRIVPPAWRYCLIAILLLLIARPGTGQLLEDPPQVLDPKETLTEAEDDHVEAMALYAQARTLLQRNDLAGALGRYQRAWWFENDLVNIMEEIVSLAVTLRRDGEATRYAMIAAEQQEVPLEVVEKLATLLAEREQFEPALALYKKCLAGRKDAAARADPIIQFEIGRLSLLIGEFQQSADAFSQVQAALADQDRPPMSDVQRRTLMQRPELTQALFGESFLRAGRWDDAEAAFRAADAAKPNSAILALRLATIETARGNRQKSLELLATFFESKSSSAGMTPYRLLARLIDGPDANEGDDEKIMPPDPEKVPSASLIDQLRKLAENDPDNAMLHYYWADTLRRAGILDEAEGIYTRLLQQANAADGYVGLVDIYYQQKNYQALLKQLGEVVGKTGSLDVLATALDPIVNDPKVLEALDKQASTTGSGGQDTLSSGVAMALALLHAEAENVELAQQYLDRALDQPGPGKGQFAVNFAFELLRLDQPRRAASTLQRVIDEKLLPDRTGEIYYYLAGAWAFADEHEKAIAAARRAAALAPSSAQMAARVPWAYFQAQKTKQAEESYLAILDRFESPDSDPENREVLREVRMMLSTVLVEQDRLDDAEEWLQQVLDAYPQDVGALNDLGYLWCDRRKHLNRALSMVQQAVAADPENAAYRDSLGWALYRLERYDEAVIELEKAADSERVDGVVLDHLGDAYLKADQPQKAIQTWQRAVAAFEKQADEKRQKTTEDKIKTQQKY